MAWVPLDVSDIQNSLTEQEQSGMSAEAAQSDLTVIVQSVIGLVRGKVNSNKRNQGHLGPAGTIPDELYAAAISIARFKWLTHLPGTQLITVDRRADKDEALQLLADAATGALVVIRGDDVNEESPLVDATSGASGTDLRGYGWPYWIAPDPELNWPTQ